jgi:N-carbamoyl-L-amino-acid hydrolase
VSTVLTLSQLNQADRDTFVRLLAGTYEHSPWIAERAFTRRPADGFVSLAQLEHAMVSVVREASEDEALALIRAHPELAGKAMVSQTLTAESSTEQGKAGLTDCTPAEFEHIQRLNAAYNARFGWPFIMAVRGPRGTGLSRAEIIATFERRAHGTREFEFAECLRHIHRIAQIRLNEKFGQQPRLGEQVWDWAEALAAHSEPGYAERGELTVTYLTDAHRACAAQLAAWMRESGFDQVGIDAVGNVVGVYHGQDPAAPRVMTGSHYDTVRNWQAQGWRPKQGLEVVGFAEEEGQRYKATFLGSGALTGHFDPAWLDQADVDGITMRQAMQHAGLPATLEAIAALKRDAAQYQGFIEVHIEQGPVLDDLDLPLGVVTSINGSARYLGHYQGVASHAGTTPMNRRRDAAVAAAELALYAEARASADEDSVATVGQLNVPSGSINVVPGQCRFSLDLRAPTNPQRNALVADIKQQAQRIAERRRVSLNLEETMVASAAPSHPDWQARWEAAVRAQGLPVHRLPSGAGHDAMKLHELMPQAMLFVRGGNAGISHNPLESVTADDTELAARAFQHLIEHL